ncbi:PhoX family phosphatase [Aeromicrobium fastidiosum]|uniref:PhoX family protein n=1 Tax=Aeromicrobium fastidiosum TaxID=52699 RepID=UPI002023435B|nr:PhoX family phosphatase [Aeromicrobium fastidiosum]MCL8249960.1 PhoX family phosphatase [Aeromicrobium fastidiosum]
MSIAPDRPLLPVIGHGTSSPCSSGRAALTCRYRCGDACAHEAPNASSNETFADVMESALSRRSVLRAGAVVGAAAVAGAGLAGSPAAAAGPKGRPSGPGGPAGHHGARTPKGLRFTPVAPNVQDAVVTPPGYDQQVVISWGDPLFRRTPAFDLHQQSAERQKRQFGFNNDFVGVLPLAGRTRLMVVNHEYTSETLMFPGYDAANPTREQVETAWAAHGLSVVAVREDRRTGALEPVVGHRLNRRFHTTSEFELTGPVAGHPLVRTSADPAGRTALGTLNNCSGGLTPWGTWLTAEENINQYFANAATVADPLTAKRLARYGIAGTATERKWERFDDRFDIAKEPNEANRFGWIVEIDPYDPTSTPRKRTALGRFKHEAAQPRITDDGHVAVYMGDDERFDYFYKFVSAKTVRTGSSASARRHNADLLDEGTLYVARFTGDSPTVEIDGTGRLPADGQFDGSGEWIPLVSGRRSFVPGMTAEEVLLFTRLAADTVGATKMDRPEDVEPSPRTGAVYIALTNNSNRGAAGAAGPDEANPRKANKNGHVIELVERRGDAGATRFAWNILLLCGDPADPSTYFGGYAAQDVSPISCPDNLAFDRYGNLWISTDGNALGSHDGLFGVAVEGPERGATRQFLTVPTGAETCGPVIERDRVLVAVQHPGEKDGATATAPASTWPDGAGRVPRPSVVAVWQRSGRSIGM